MCSCDYANGTCGAYFNSSCKNWYLSTVKKKEEEGKLIAAWEEEASE